jgi:hypothetical protein
MSESKLPKIQFPFISPKNIENMSHGYHSNVMARYFMACKNIKAEISFSEILRHGLANKKASRYQFFEFSINDIVCCFNMNDVPCLNLLNATSVNGQNGKIEVAFVCQLTRKQTGECLNIYQNTGVRIYPFPMPLLYYYNWMPIYELSYKNCRKKYLAHMNFGTLHRKFRQEWLNFARQHESLFRFDFIGGDVFMDMLVNDVKWGINLKGRGRDGKCHRESEFMLLGLPLALTYKPFYPFEFEENKHYIFLKQPKDILKLQNIDPVAYAKESLQIGQKYIHPNGMISLMLDIINNTADYPLQLQKMTDECQN